MINPYSDFHRLPVEAFVVEDEDADYSFDTMLFLRDKNTGLVYFAADSGCSCPTPFEDYTGENWDKVRDKMERIVLRDALLKFDSYGRRPDKTPLDLRKWWKQTSKR